MRPDANANADANADANRSKAICRPPLKGVDIINYRIAFGKIELYNLTSPNIVFFDRTF